MADAIAARIKEVSEEQFKLLLQSKKIRPASLFDVSGTHHSRALYRHPRTGDLFVKVPTDEIG